MQIHRVKQDLIVTNRLAGLGHRPLKVLVDLKGNVLVAMDPVGVKPGDWVFSIANSAARLAAGDVKLLTDLAVAGIIDNWQQFETDN